MSLPLSAPQQLLLGLKLESSPRLDNFVPGVNAELLSKLTSLARTRRSGSLYLWGPKGCGKSHLLSGTASAAHLVRPVRHLPANAIGSDLPLEAGTLVIIDDAEQLSADAQITVFRAFNDVRHLDLDLLLSGTEPPLRLPLREDLRTRIGQSLIYEIQPLTDDEKTAALQSHASERGMSIEPNVLAYLLRYGRRDLPALMGMLDALDHASLEFKRPPTLPLLRELMQTALELETR